MGQSTTELRHEIAQTRQNMGETLDAIGDRVSPGRMVERRRNRATRAARSIVDRVMGSASSVGDTLSSSAHGAVESLEQSPDMVGRQAAGNPLVAGAVAFGIGALVAAAIPPTSAERARAQEIGERVEPIRRELTDAAREVVGDLREPAQQAVDEVTERAQEAVHDVRETVAGSPSAGSTPTPPPRHDLGDSARHPLT